MHGLNWWGLSAIASLRDDMRPGVGMLLHYGRMVTVGASWHDDDADDRWFDRPPYLIASFDLIQLAKERVPEYRKRVAVLAVLNRLAERRTDALLGSVRRGRHVDE